MPAGAVVTLEMHMSEQQDLAGAASVGLSTIHAETLRLAEADAGRAAWRKWGPYVSERQWGTVREDYSEEGDCWNSFPHDHARSRAYRWGEDGLLGFSDDEQRLCFALALWNGKDPILKERLFGLTGPEGNHGEDVKERYFYLDATPTHSYMKALYKYPQTAFPYARLVDENRRRGRDQCEFELDDTGVFDQSRYFDVQVEYAKRGPDDLNVRITISNRGPDAATVHVLPTLWFRNTWSWGCTETDHESCGVMPTLKASGKTTVVATHEHLGRYEMHFEHVADASPRLLFTENVSNAQRLWGVTGDAQYAKDAFHRLIVNGETDAVNPLEMGTKAAAWYKLMIPAGGTRVIRARLVRAEAADSRAGLDVDAVNRIVERRISEANAFYDHGPPSHGRLAPEARHVARQAAAGLLWSKQFYNFDVREWLEGDPATVRPPAARKNGRNSDWKHLNNRDIISMPDKWEYPWYAAWDLAFQMIPFARLDPQFAKDQLVLFLREWYMHPSGQVPAYEFAFGDVNPPVHAWAVWRVYSITAEQSPDGQKTHDRVFLARCFQKLLINFTWWVNRKDPTGKNLFSGGFLGLDNIGVFDRSRPLPTGGHLEQADGTAWMAFYCGTMLSMALELAKDDPAYEDVATKFFEHFIAITDAMNTLGGTGLWDDRDGFYYDQIRVGDQVTPLRVRSLVGVIPLLAVELLESSTIDRLPDFKRRMEWFLAHRTDLPWAEACACGHSDRSVGTDHRLLAMPSRQRLERVVARLLDEAEFLSRFGVRSVSRAHEKSPFVLQVAGEEHRVEYCPGESTTALFGGNSNWRGPIWFPLNFLIIEALERYHRYYGDGLRVPCSGRMMTLAQAADEIRRRLSSLFLPEQSGHRPCHGDDEKFASDPAWRDLVLFHEYFHAETGRGLGASHQTGWTALVLETLLPRPAEPSEEKPAGQTTSESGRETVATAQ